MKKILIGLTIVISFGLTMLLPTPSHTAPQDDNIIIPRWWERPRIVHKLQIQKKTIHSIIGATKDDLVQSSELRKTLHQHRSDLRILLAADNFDEYAVRQKSEAALSTFSSLMKLEANIQINAVKELTVDQRRNLLKMRDNIGKAVKKRIQEKR